MGKRSERWERWSGRFHDNGAGGGELAIGRVFAAWFLRGPADWPGSGATDAELALRPFVAPLLVGDPFTDADGFPLALFVYWFGCLAFGTGGGGGGNASKQS